MDVLLIDDEPSIRETLATFLREESHAVRTAATGEDGLWALEDRPAELVLTDVRMPGISGLEVLRRVREAWPATEVVVITGYATVEDAVEALRHGAYDFLLKPVRLAHLESVVRRCDERVRAARDNRELRAVVEKLRDINRRKEKFLALANHELRTPTTVAAGLVSVLMSHALSLPPESRELLGRVDEALRRLREVVEDLGDLALTQTGKLELKRVREGLGRIADDLRGVCGMYRGLRDLRIDLECEAPEDLELNVDGRKLRRAISALLQNAVKYTPDGGRIVLRVVSDGPDLLFRIEDSGVGVPEEEAQTIFELFYEASDTRHHKTSVHEFQGGGMGVGLPLAAAITRAHGGTLTFEPRPTGGSVFDLRIPIDDARSPAAVPPTG